MPLAVRQYRNRPARTFTYRYYYFVGSQRIATYTYTDTGEQYWLLSDHLGSTSVTADVDGDFYSETRYSAFGEVRYSLNNTPRTTYTPVSEDVGFVLGFGGRMGGHALVNFTPCTTTYFGGWAKAVIPQRGIHLSNMHARVACRTETMVIPHFVRDDNEG